MKPTNNINRRAFGTLAAGLALSIGLGASVASAENLETVKENGVLRVGVLSDYPPYGFIDAEQKLQGYDVDIASALSEGLGVDLELVPVTAPNRIPFLLTNKVDAVIAAMGITPERLRQINFSNPYAKQSNLLLANKDAEISGVEDLSDFTVGLVRASAQDIILTEEVPEGTRLMRFDDDATTFQALVSGQVETISASSTVLDQLDENFPQLNIVSKFTVRDQPLGVAMRLEDIDLQERINEILADAIESDALNQMHVKWFEKPLGELPPMPTVDG